MVHERELFEPWEVVIMPRKKFVGMEFGVLYGDKVKKVRVPASKYDHFIYNTEVHGGIACCVDAFNCVVFGVPLDSLVYVKSMENGAW